MSISVFPAASGGNGIALNGFSRYEKIDSSGTWSHPDGYAEPRFILVFAVGGGGGGGRGPAVAQAGSGNWSYSGGAGGGTGGWDIQSINNTSQLTITIGSGGAGAPSASTTSSTTATTAGSTGGTTSIVQNSVTLVSCTGGGGGGGGVYAASTTRTNAAAGTGGSPNGIAGGVTEAVPAALTTVSNIAAPINALSFPIPILPYSILSSPSGGAGGGSVSRVSTSTPVLHAAASLVAIVNTQIPFYGMIGLGNGGAAVFSATSSASITSDPGVNGDGIGCGGGGSGSAAKISQSGSASATCAKGGDGGDGAVWIFY